MEGRITGPHEHDLDYLERAAALGRKGWGQVHPNPMVGCLLVKDDHVVGEGYHAVYGGPHAEVEALRNAGDNARGSTAYVSLEPCSHHGKTPPCVEALLGAGVRRVVFGASDPGIRASGGGAWLASRGVSVTGPVFSQERWRAENPFFFHDHPDRPFVAVKLAASLDGAISEAPGQQTAVTGPEAQAAVQRLRGGYDAVLVGSGTWRADDPRLDARGTPSPRVQPYRVFLDGQGDFPETAASLAVAEGGGVVLITTSSGRTRLSERLQGRADIITVPTTEGGGDGWLDLEAALVALRSKGINSVLCEGGGYLASALLRGGFVDRLYWFLAPTVLGEQGVRALPDLARDELGTWRAVEPPTLHGSDTLHVYDKVI